MIWRVLSALTWELPQTLLGLLVLVFTRGYGRKPDWNLNYMVGSYVVFWRKAPFGVSLGPIIILGRVFEGMEEEVVLHEWGHSKQSLILGPLYLIVVGLPSIVMNILSRLWIIDPTRYYERWPESWADRLGGVKR
jgi:hypothetical protein